MWSNDEQAAMLGDEAKSVMERAVFMRAAGLWPKAHAMRFRLASGEAAWLRVTSAGALQCVAIAPWDDTWQVDCVSEVDMFGRGVWPSTWRRKSRMDRKTTLPVHAAGYECGWAVGLYPDKMRVTLCKPTAWTGRTLEMVQTMDDGPEVPISSHVAVKWWPFDRFHQGCEALWTRRHTDFPNYRFLAICASNEMRRLGLLPKVVRKRAKPPKD